MKTLKIVVPGMLIDSDDEPMDEHIEFFVDNKFENANNPQCIIESETGSIIFTIDKYSAKTISKYFEDLSKEL